MGVDFNFSGTAWWIFSQGDKARENNLAIKGKKSREMVVLRVFDLINSKKCGKVCTVNRRKRKCPQNQNDGLNRKSRH